MNAAFLAFAYLRYHWVRSLVLVLVLALILIVPFATRILLAESEASLTARAEATPLLLGRRGSALDLTMAALYFSDDRPDALPMAEVEAVWDSGLAIPIPLHTAFETNGFRIIGTPARLLRLSGPGGGGGARSGGLGRGRGGREGCP